MLSPTRNSRFGSHRGTSATLILFYVGACMLCVACHVNVNYRPYISGKQPPLLTRARIAYEGDVQALADAGGFLIGTIDADADDDFRSSIEDEARDIAAERGGTHVILTNQSVAQQLVQIAPDRVHVAPDGNGYTATYHSGSVPINIASATYAVIRVPKKHWHRLPANLRFPNPHVIRQ
jgi:hypothetical protein